MRKAQTFAKKITEWDLLNANIKPHLADMPYLQDIVTELDALVTEARGLDGEQEVARGQFQDLTHRRQEVEKRGENLRRRAASHLRGSFGFTSDALVKFGVRPRKTGPRGPRKSKPATPPAST
jgi:hypothetical protein